MIDKTNLLLQYAVSGQEPPDPMPITPYTEGQLIAFENAICLLAGKERTGVCQEDQEVLYFISGTGTLRANTEEVGIETGDRVILIRGQEYAVRNTGTEPIYYLNIGIKLDS